VPITAGWRALRGSCLLRSLLYPKRERSRRRRRARSSWPWPRAAPPAAPTPIPKGARTRCAPVSLNPTPTEINLCVCSGILLVDVRSHGYHDSGAARIRGSIRIEPNNLSQEIKSFLRTRISTYTALERAKPPAPVAYLLREQGLNAFVIVGGLAAWRKAGQPVGTVPDSDLSASADFQSVASPSCAVTKTRLSRCFLCLRPNLCPALSRRLRNPLSPGSRQNALLYAR
jgi:rhodanese-related sulfurtransferase